MYRNSFVSGFAATILFLSGAQAESPNDKAEAVTIPLDRIWAREMPGTRDIEKLDPKRPLVYEIRRAIGFPPKDKEAQPAFAVLGTGLDALREAHAVFVEKKKPRDRFPAASEVSVVFFSYQFGPYVHVHEIARQGNIVDIRYRFVPHEEQITAEGIALIPLGKLGAGKYRVDIIQTPMEQKYLDKGFRPVSEANARRIVSRSFSFAVSEQGE
ncbi:MAG: hypothetical protein WD738_18790 [Pirellulales bacterium]